MALLRRSRPANRSIDSHTQVADLTSPSGDTFPSEFVQRASLWEIFSLLLAENVLQTKRDTLGNLESFIRRPKSEHSSSSSAPAADMLECWRSRGQITQLLLLQRSSITTINTRAHCSRALGVPSRQLPISAAKICLLAVAPRLIMDSSSEPISPTPKAQSTSLAAVSPGSCHRNTSSISFHLARGRHTIKQFLSTVCSALVTRRDMQVCHQSQSHYKKKLLAASKLAASPGTAKGKHELTQSKRRRRRSSVVAIHSGEEN